MKIYFVKPLDNYIPTTKCVLYILHKILLQVPKKEAAIPTIFPNLKRSVEYSPATEGDDQAVEGSKKIRILQDIHLTGMAEIPRTTTVEAAKIT